LDEDSCDDDPPVEKVVSVPMESKSPEDEDDGGVEKGLEDLRGGGAEGAPKPPIVGGAVGSCIPAAARSSGEGAPIGPDVIFVNMIPQPSMRARIKPPKAAAVAICLGPARAASIPPVAAPETIEFHGSS